MSDRDGPDASAAGPGAGVTTTVHEGVCRLRAPAEWRWLVTGPGGGRRRARAAYNVTVPEGFDRTDLDAYVREQRREAGFDATADAPALLTGVAMRHARVAVRGPVTVVATGGLSNPATLPLPGTGRSRFGGNAGSDGGDGGDSGGDGGGSGDEGRDDGDAGDRAPVGTVNLLVATDRALAAGTSAELLATAVEAKTATLLAATGFSGTTSDAVAVGCAPAGDPADFAGSATAVGAATRACVRDALLAALDARYDGREGELPDSVGDAAYGVVTDGAARVFAPERGE
jgi:adenosylcobinamide hydrolase